MGWSCTYKRPCQSLASFFEEHGVLSWSADLPRTYQVLDTAFVGLAEFYAALEITEKATGERRIVPLIILVKLFRKDRDGLNICYKDIGLDRHNCPERILNLLTPTEDEGQRVWLKACLEKINARKRIPRLKKGVVMDFSEPVNFSSGPVSRLVVDEVRGQRIVCTDENAYRWYHLKRPWLNTQAVAGRVTFA